MSAEKPQSPTLNVPIGASIAASVEKSVFEALDKRFEAFDLRNDTLLAFQALFKQPHHKPLLKGYTERLKHLLEREGISPAEKNALDGLATEMTWSDHILYAHELILLFLHRYGNDLSVETKGKLESLAADILKASTQALEEDDTAEVKNSDAENSAAPAETELEQLRRLCAAQAKQIQRLESAAANDRAQIEYQKRVIAELKPMDGLFAAIKEGDVKYCETFHEKGLPIDFKKIRYEDGYYCGSVLSYTAAADCPSEARFFILTGLLARACTENVDIKERMNERIYNNDQTPLHVVAKKGDVDSVQLLLSHGADKDTTTSDDLTPVLLAARHGHTAVVKHLIDNGAKADITSILCEATLYNHNDLIDYCLNEHLEKISFLEQISFNEGDGDSIAKVKVIEKVIERVIEKDDLPMLINLLERYPSQENEHLALLYAVFSGRLRILTHLVETSGIDAQIIFRTVTFTPLMAAIMRIAFLSAESEPCPTEVPEGGPESLSRSAPVQTAVLERSSPESTLIAEFLINKGANVHFTLDFLEESHPANGRTALDLVTRDENPDPYIARLLCQKGARLTNHSNELAKEVFFDVKYEQLLEQTRKRYADAELTWEGDCLTADPRLAPTETSTDADRQALALLQEIIKKKFGNDVKDNTASNKIMLYALIHAYLQTYDGLFSPEADTCNNLFMLAADLVRSPLADDIEADDEAQSPVEAKEEEESAETGLTLAASPAAKNIEPSPAGAVEAQGTPPTPKASTSFFKFKNPFSSASSETTAIQGGKPKLKEEEGGWSSRFLKRAKAPEQPRRQSVDFEVPVASVVGTEGSLN